MKTLLLAVLLASPAAAATPSELDGENLRSFFSAPLLALLSLYQNALGPAKGATCRMLPSDSRYAEEAIRRRGPFWGALMAADRLHRCGHDAERYRARVVGGRLYWLDPVE